jgi:two-component system, NarL family, sensor histidine kinase DesK
MDEMGIDAWLERPPVGFDYPPETRFRRTRMRVGVVLGALFLAGPASDLAHAHIGAAHRAGLAVGMAAFVGLYVALLPPGPWLERRGRRAHAVGLGILATIAAALLIAGAPASFAALFVYVAAASGLLLRPRNAVFVTLLTGAGVGIVAIASGASRSGVGVTVLTIVSIGALMAAFGRQVRANQQLREARGELARLAVADERLRIARDLHDLLGHTLSVIALKSELAQKLVERDPARAASELGDIQAVTRQALGEVREAVHAYRQLALGEALSGARAALAAAGIECRLDEESVSLPPDVEAVLAWAVREGTTNVVRHSRARSCAIRVLASADSAAVEVEDDGEGGTAGTAGSGLAGLAERAARVRGSLEAGARPEGGFRLRLTVPLAA